MIILNIVFVCACMSLAVCSFIGLCYVIRDMYKEGDYVIAVALASVYIILVCVIITAILQLPADTTTTEYM